MVDPWEATQSEYQRTAVVLDHFNDEINQVFGGAVTKDGASYARWHSYLFNQAFLKANGAKSALCYLQDQIS